MSLQNLVNEKQAAELLCTTPGTLQVWRCTRRQEIPYVKIGRSVRYRLEDIQHYIQSRTVGVAAE